MLPASSVYDTIVINSRIMLLRNQKIAQPTEQDQSTWCTYSTVAMADAAGTPLSELPTFEAQLESMSDGLKLASVLSLTCLALSCSLGTLYSVCACVLNTV